MQRSLQFADNCRLLVKLMEVITVKRLIF